MLSPTGKAKIAFERGIVAGAVGECRTTNPYRRYGHASDMLAAWWSTGYEKGKKQSELSTGERGVKCD